MRDRIIFGIGYVMYVSLCAVFPRLRRARRPSRACAISPEAAVLAGSESQARAESAKAKRSCHRTHHADGEAHQHGMAAPAGSPAPNPRLDGYTLSRAVCGRVASPDEPGEAPPRRC